MKNKIISYLGFAKRAGKLVSGTGTCTVNMAKGNVRLMILATDISDNGRKKIMKEIRRYGVPYIVWGESEELSHTVGAQGRSVFAICDKGFADAILKETEEEACKEVVE